MSTTKLRPVKKAKPKKAIPDEKVFSEYRKIIDARYRLATQTYDAQDAETQEVIDRIRDRLRLSATGVVNVDGVPKKLEPKLVDFNLLFLATEILSDLFLFGIRVANFTPNPSICQECKSEIYAVPQATKKKRR